ncbi:MAG: hypothetical protein ABEN55_04805 [Bradymonadaceae bacterium]
MKVVDAVQKGDFSVLIDGILGTVGMIMGFSWGFKTVYHWRPSPSDEDE